MMLRGTTLLPWILGGVLALGGLILITYRMDTFLLITTSSGSGFFKNLKLSKIQMKASADSWTPPILPLHLSNTSQDDPDLIKHIREFWIIPPFKGERNIGELRKTYSQQGQPGVINGLLKNKTGGFMVECGAGNGLQHSNSLFFELYKDYSGLLIEANPNFFKKVLGRRRRMYMINACLSPTTTPIKVTFTVAGISGGITDYIPPGQVASVNLDKQPRIQVQCFPLFSILAAVGVSHVEYFSLDIEGAEVEVLRTVPFDKVTIDTLTVEKRMIDDAEGTKRKEEAVLGLLAPHGYKFVGRNGLDVIVSRV